MPAPTADKVVTVSEPHWPAIVAALSVGLLHYAMPDALTVGPAWLILALVSLLLIPTTIFRTMQRQTLHRLFAYGVLGVITSAMLMSVVLLIRSLLNHSIQPAALLRAAAMLWVSNVLVFASWYWRLDGGGPHERSRRGAHEDGAFLFPQMMMTKEQRRQMGEDNWSPGFVDYLFLAFNTSTAFSPTDVPVLSRWAKSMMIVQSMISLATVVLLAARAVNVL